MTTSIEYNCASSRPAWSTGRVPSWGACCRMGVVVDLDLRRQPAVDLRRLVVPRRPAAVAALVAGGRGGRPEHRTAGGLGRAATGPAGEPSGPGQPARPAVAPFLVPHRRVGQRPAAPRRGRR
jgi:hypothetical protein